MPKYRVYVSTVIERAIEVEGEDAFEAEHAAKNEQLRLERDVHGGFYPDLPVDWHFAEVPDSHEVFALDASGSEIS